MKMINQNNAYKGFKRALCSNQSFLTDAEAKPLWESFIKFYRESEDGNYGDIFELWAIDNLPDYFK